MSHRAACLAVLLLVGCRQRDQQDRSVQPTSAAATPAAPASEESRWYRLVIVEDSFEVPFFVSLPSKQGAGRAMVANGDERADTPAQRRGSHVRIDFPVYGNRLELDIESDRVSGTWHAQGLLGKDFAVSGTAVGDPDPAVRIAPGDDPPITDVSGIWVLDLPGLGAPGKARFTQRPDGVVEGTLIASDLGDARFLAGRLRGRTLSLSTFSGMWAVAVVAELSGDGKRMTGVWRYLGWEGHEFSAQRGRDILPAQLQRARMKPGHQRLSVPELEEPRYRNKPVIIDWFGTWCASCQDLTPILVDAYRRHHPAGLEVLSIALEPFEQAEAERMLAAYRDQYQVPYDITLLLVEGDTLATSLPPELEGVVGFPVTVFVNRDGTVRGVHTGAISPAAGEDYKRFRADLDRMVEEIVASTP